MHGRTTGIDRLGQNRLLVFDELASLVQHLVHTLGTFVGQLMGMRFGSLRMPSQQLLRLTTKLRCQQQRRCSSQQPSGHKHQSFTILGPNKTRRQSESWSKQRSHSIA